MSESKSKRWRWSSRDDLIPSVVGAGRSAFLAALIALVSSVSSPLLYGQVQVDSSAGDIGVPPLIIQTDTSSLPTTPVTPEVSPPTKSPALAIGLSAILPGAGQVYAERYWSIPIIWGFGIWLGVNFKQANDLYAQYRDEYSNSIGSPEFGPSGDPQALSLRDFYHNERDRFGAFLLLTYLLNLVDAYVGASLYGFDVSEDLTGSSNLRFQLRIPIR